MKMKHRIALLLIVPACMGLQSCTLHTVNESPGLPLEMPGSFSQTGDIQTPSRWWEAFHDEILNQMIDRALAGNFGLRLGWARLEQAKAIARQAGAQGRLQLSYNAGAQKNRSVVSIGGRTNSSESDSITHSLAASYEVDVWNRIASQERAAGLDLLAARFDVETIAITLASNITDTWFSIAEALATANLLNRQIEVSQTFLDLTEARFGQGMASAVDVLQQRSQLASIRAQIPLVETQEKVLKNQLAVLLGTPPPSDSTQGIDTLPNLSEIPATGVPANLLTNRPDVQAARMRLVAADHRIAAAIADKYPILSLTGRMGLGGEDIKDLFSNWIWTLAANTVVPILDGDRRSAEVDRTRAVVQERLLQYGNTVLNAIQEVENALAREQQQREYIKRLMVQMDVNRQTLEESRSRYTSGLSDYLPVLTALQSVQNLERTEIQARMDLVAFRIQLHRALGGAWTNSLENDETIHADS